MAPTVFVIYEQKIKYVERGEYQVLSLRQSTKISLTKRKTEKNIISGIVFLYNVHPVHKLDITWRHPLCGADKNSPVPAAYALYFVFPHDLKKFHSSRKLRPISTWRSFLLHSALLHSNLFRYLVKKPQKLAKNFAGKSQMLSPPTFFWWLKKFLPSLWFAI